MDTVGEITDRSGPADGVACDLDLDLAEVDAAVALIRLQVATRVRLSNLRHPYRAAARVAADGPILDVVLSIDRGGRPSLLIESAVA